MLQLHLTEWSTIILPTKLWLILEVWRYIHDISIFYPLSESQHWDALLFEIQGPIYPAYSILYHYCWSPGDAGSQGISCNGSLTVFSFITTGVDMWISENSSIPGFTLISQSPRFDCLSQINAHHSTPSFMILGHYCGNPCLFSPGNWFYLVNGPIVTLMSPCGAERDIFCL